MSKGQDGIRILAEMVNEAYQLFGWCEDILPPEYQKEVLAWMDRFVSECASIDSPAGAVMDLFYEEDPNEKE